MLMQDILLDRRKVYQQLQVSIPASVSWMLTYNIQHTTLLGGIGSALVCVQKSGIPVPLHIIVDRDSLAGDQKDPEGFIETEDYVELNGEVYTLQSAV